MISKEGLIAKFNIIHNNKYDYSKIEYNDWKDKILINCPLHGEFIQRITGHSQGNGCPKCGIELKNSKLTKKGHDYLDLLKLVHGDKYDYSKVVYQGGANAITIICPIHGEFEQNARGHSRGQGCPKCHYETTSLANRDTKESFIEKSIKIHGNKYNYDLVDYVNQMTKVDIVCKIHGAFSQQPNSHLCRKEGCPICGNTAGTWSYTKWEEQGFSSTKFESFKIYVIECWNDTERFFKIGKTFRTIGQRYHAKSDLPYEWRVVYTEQGSARYVCELERELINKHFDVKYIPKIKFRGGEECFSAFRN